MLFPSNALRSSVDVGNPQDVKLGIAALARIALQPLRLGVCSSAQELSLCAPHREGHDFEKQKSVAVPELVSLLAEEDYTKVHGLGVHAFLLGLGGIKNK